MPMLNKENHPTPAGQTQAAGQRSPGKDQGEDASNVLAAFAKDTGPAADAIRKLLEDPTPEKAAALMKDLPTLIPEDPAMAAVIAEEMAKEFGSVSAANKTDENGKEHAEKGTAGAGQFVSSEGGDGKESTVDNNTEHGKSVYSEQHREKIGQTGTWKTLGLPALRDIDADPPITFNDIEESKRRILKGETVTNPFGEVLHIDDRSMEHIGKKGRNPEQLKDKLQSLDAAKETVEHPHEVWLGDNNRRLYVRITKESNGRRVVNAVEQMPDLLLSWHTNPVSYDHYRHGVLQWLR